MRQQDLETLEKGHGHAANGHANGYTNGFHKQPPAQQRKKSELWSPANVRALTYGAMNVVSASGIVSAHTLRLTGRPQAYQRAPGGIGTARQGSAEPCAPCAQMLQSP